MSEKYQKIIAYEVNYFCDECGEPMLWNGVTLTTYPAQYGHICKNGHARVFRNSYPYIAHKIERGLTQRAGDGLRRLWSVVRSAIRRA